MDDHPELRPLYAHRPTLEGMGEAIKARNAYEAADSRVAESRKLLGQVLRKQYNAILPETELPALQLKQIQKLETGAHAIVTAHQLNLFTGPLYMIFKAVSAIKLSRDLAKAYPVETFVPVFYLGSEDHDLPEINHFRLFGKRFEWERPVAGATGRFSTEGLSEVHTQLAEVLGEGAEAKELAALFEAAYLKHETLAQAQQFLLHHLMGTHDLLVLDADDVDLKASFSSVMKRELLESFSQQAAADACSLLESSWKVQASPREINLFYLQGAERRDRIERDADNSGSNSNSFQVVNSDKTFSQEELLQELSDSPASFSPNVILRPLYQDWILPTLTYIGGGGELAYWFELKAVFEAAGIPFPVLLLRNSGLLIDAASRKKIDKLGLATERLFEREDMVRKNWLLQNETAEINLADQKEALEKLFADIAAKAETVDPTLKKKALAEGQNQLKALGKLEGQLLKAAKQRHELSLNQITKVHEKLFPEASLQERKENFASFYLRGGDSWITELIEQFDPLDLRFTVIG